MAEKKRIRRQSDIEATRRYDAKTYKKMNIAFRVDDDADIISALDNAHDLGVSSRELIRSWYETANEKQSI